jgi:hypothetical protein
VFPLGASTVTCRATDSAGLSASASFTITVRDTTPPTLSLTADSVSVVLPSASATGATVDVLASSHASATDLGDASPSLTHDAPALFPLGTTVVTFTATDDAGNSAQRAFVVRVVYGFLGFQTPVRSDGSSVFRSGRVVPLKFQLAAADGSLIVNASATLQVSKVTDAVLGTVEELTPEAAGTSNSGNVFRFDMYSQSYIYNLNTSGFSTGTYILRAVDNVGTAREVRVSVR